MEHEQPEILAQFAVVALLGFLDPLQVGLEVGVGRERGPVDALHRLVVRVPLPIGIGGAQKLERLQPVGRGHVRTDTEVDEGLAAAGGVGGHLGLTRGLLLDQLHLQRFALVGEEPQRFLTRPHLAGVGEVARGELLHPLLDCVQVLGCERPFHHEVVEEAFVCRRPDAALGTRIQLRDRRGQQMRGAVPDQAERLGTVSRDDPDDRPVVKREGQVNQTVVDHGRQRSSTQTWRDHASQVACSGALAHGTARAVG